VVVAQRRCGGEQLRRIDDDGRLADQAPFLDIPRQRVEIRYDATLRSSYAGGTPAFTASCSRTIPSIS
jgi:hypothetical protein